MQLLKKLLTPTPLKASSAIILFFLGIAALYDINPKLVGWVSTLSEKTIDYKFRIRGAQKAKSRIVIVAADEKSLQAFGQWPFDRAKIFAPLFDNLCKYGPKVIGLDVVWTDPERQISSGFKSALSEQLHIPMEQIDTIAKEGSGDEKLATSLGKCAGKVVLGYALDSSDAGGATGPDFQERIKTLTSQGKNTLSALTRGNIVYGNGRGDPNANVDFFRVAHSGLLNLNSIIPPNAAQGFFNNEQDSDGNYRSAFVVFKAGDYFVPSLALRMAQKILGPEDTPASIFIQGDDPEHGLIRELRIEMNLPTGKRRLPTDLSGQLIVNYRGPNYTFPQVSMADVLSREETVEYQQFEDGELKKVKMHKSELFKDASVLIGVTAMALYDIRPRPLEEKAFGVENHANILDNLLNDDFLVRPTTENLVWMLGLVAIASIGFAFAVSKLSALLGAAFALLAIVGALYFDQVYLFNTRGVVFSGQLLAIQFLVQYIVTTIMKFRSEETEKKFIRSAFNKYVSPAIIDSMLSDPTKLKLGGEKKELSIMFSDIRGFTQLSERVDVKALTQFLNEYLGSMTDILQANSGTLDKYIGDAVMGFWGAPVDLPNHAELAVKTAVEMIQKLDDLNAEFQKKYGFTIDIGMGINSGHVSVGNFGSSRVFEYTVIGDNVNLASRLEGLNKYYGTHIIVSEATFQALPANRFMNREVDTVKVKGKKKPVKIYEIFPDDTKHHALKGALTAFNEGLGYYYSQKWNDALKVFQSVLQARDGDRPTLELMERCRHYMNNPPGRAWDGSWEMHSK